MKCQSFYLCPKHSEQRKHSGVFQGKDPPCLVLRVKSGGPFPVWGKGDFSHLEGVSCVLREEAWHQAPASKTSSAERSILQCSCKHHVFLHLQTHGRTSSPAATGHSLLIYFSSAVSVSIVLTLLHISAPELLPVLGQHGSLSGSGMGGIRS